jgi:hypothetical protein
MNALLALLGWLPVDRTPLGPLLGGSALQMCLDRGWIGYNFVVCRRVDDDGNTLPHLPSVGCAGPGSEGSARANHPSYVTPCRALVMRHCCRPVSAPRQGAQWYKRICI